MGTIQNSFFDRGGFEADLVASEPFVQAALDRVGMAQPGNPVRVSPAVFDSNGA